MHAVASPVSIQSQLAERIGLSMSRGGRVIANAANARKIESYVREHCSRVTGSSFDGMIDGLSKVEHTIDSAIQTMHEVMGRSYAGNSIYISEHFETKQMFVVVGDCCDHVTFYF